jgi:hypothetical protein
MSGSEPLKHVSEEWPMSRFVVSWKRLGLVLLVAAMALVAVAPVLAQRLAGANAPGLAQGGAPLPPPSHEGAWGEVIMANAKWLVVQNQAGQQFPIATDSVTQFLIRWPIALADLTNESVVEAIGQEFGSNVLRTDHIDVFEGTDRNLVNPTYTSLLPNNRPVTALDPGFSRFMNPWDIGAQNLLYGWAFPVAPGELGIPSHLHVVGSVIGINPLRLLLLGNNFATVMPDEAGNMAVFQMTRGNSSFAEKGDLVYMLPTDLTPRTVVLSQLVLYKKIPLRQFRMP